MAKQVTFKTIFLAVSIPLNDNFSINEKEFRVYLSWTTKALMVSSATGTLERSPASQGQSANELLRSAQKSAATS